VEGALRSLPRGATDESWPWPEPRLIYANASVPEALIAAGDVLGDETSVGEGLRQLRWLAEEERLGDHLSFAPTGGRGPGDPRPGFDQQPIEAAALADACARAFDVTRDASWLEPLALCAGWFEGSNDLGLPMFDPETGGGCDGMHPDRVNENQGAESTIAFVTTMQQARRLGVTAGRTAQRAASSASSS
ncbi:MAG: glycosyltransferase, partial [Actinomycetota bacterium]